MTKINYKSDFDFLLSMFVIAGFDSRGKPILKKIGIPDCDWEAQITTSSKLTPYIISSKNGVNQNWYNDNGNIHAIVNNHWLKPGELKIEAVLEWPDSKYPDGYKRCVYPMAECDIELVEGAGDNDKQFKIDTVFNYIRVKGDPFTYDDFTSEQITELKRPATEAAKMINTLAEDERRAELLRESAEQERIKSETLRVSAEDERQEAERMRVVNEEERVKAEDERQEAERMREETFAGFENAIDSKADRSELSNIYAETPLSEINFPEIKQLTREQLKKDLFNDMWKSIGGIKLDNGNYRMGADGKELTYEKAIERYNLNDLVEVWNEAFIVRDSSYGQKIHGRYNESTCFFEGNGVNDITKEQAMQILDLGKPSANTGSFASAYPRIRTNIPIFPNRSGWGEAFFGNSRLEVVNLGHGTYTLTGYYAFYACSSLRSIMGKLRAAQNATIDQCPSLVDVTIAFTKAGVTYNLNFSSRLSVESVRYTVVNSMPCTLVVHKNVYAKLTGDTTNAAAAALTPEELEQWQQVMSEATEKDIIFATT